MEEKSQEGLCPPHEEDAIGPKPTSTPDKQPSAGTSDRGDTLQASEKITPHDTTLDHTCTLGHTLGRQGGGHMLRLSLRLVATLVTSWTLCNFICLTAYKNWECFENSQPYTLLHLEAYLTLHNEFEYAHKEFQLLSLQTIILKRKKKLSTLPFNLFSCFFTNG